MVWKPNVTVAAVLERDGRFLLVEEETEFGVCFNQPAGHLECGESLLAAVVRETLEETAYRLQPEFLLGIYNFRIEERDLTYLRFAFGGRILGHEPARALDEGILAAHWLTVDEIRAMQAQHRSPLVLRCVEDWLAGRRYPLDLLVDYHR
ncbi:MAG TPA: NUDIX hydrolase [Accumulibacter sp.]|uniref:NUDIX hydrolase n=1 Tax=Accumulibacter sp. TaxID=2053492 RepID=UPI002B806002|nr:NUDIX hydrolase [Accumulibacter sp.]HMW79540.1 NUDIX hydrolase [Accumulibacter sp.]HNG15298.1 NUDIX hydrolase [Accumulibacter sp.]HNI52619.1 NUDIX hydrolase [Accumulibacter sp.]